MAEKHCSMRELNEILNRISGLRVTVLGDLCVDVYWYADMRKSSLSRETPHFPLPVMEERVSLGAGGNVAANVCALLPADVRVIGALGKDWRSGLIARELDRIGADARFVFEEEGMNTFAYCKPLRGGISDVVYEDPRLDFVHTRPLMRQTEDHIIGALRQCAAESDVILVSDQFQFGCVTERVRETVCELGREGMLVVADSRERIGAFRGIVLKPNEMEGSAALGYTGAWEKGEGECALKLAKKCGGRVIMTLAERGSVYSDGECCMYGAAWRVSGKTDIVGAGDSFLSGFSLALAAGADPMVSADFAALCSAVTVKKIGETGTAAPDELRRAHETLLREG